MGPPGWHRLCGVSTRTRLDDGLYPGEYPPASGRIRAGKTILTRSTITAGPDPPVCVRLQAHSVEIEDSRKRGVEAAAVATGVRGFHYENAHISWASLRWRRLESCFITSSCVTGSICTAIGVVFTAIVSERLRGKVGSYFREEIQVFW